MLVFADTIEMVQCTKSLIINRFVNLVVWQIKCPKEFIPTSYFDKVRALGELNQFSDVGFVCYYVDVIFVVLCLLVYDQNRERAELNWSSFFI